MDFPSARHLAQRTGFGGTPAGIRRLMANDLATTIQILVDSVGPALKVDLPPWVDKRPARPEDTRNEEQLVELETWWLQRMLTSKVPLAERIVLFWHGFFAASTPAVPAVLHARQHRTLRNLATGNFRARLAAMIRDPALLIGLGQTDDATQRRLGQALVHRFTLGSGVLDKTQQQNINSVFDGWRADQRGRITQAGLPSDTPSWTLLGETGRWDADDIVRILLREPRAAECIIRRMYSKKEGDAA